MAPRSQARPDAPTLTGALAAVAATIAVLRALSTEPDVATSALLLLLVVLVTATQASLRVALATSVLSSLGLNFFLIPPYGTFRIADASDWIAFGVYLAVAGIGSQLSTTARRRAREAEASRLEVTRLFDLSRDILLTDDDGEVLHDVARYVGRRFGLSSGAICLPGDDGWTLHQATDLPCLPPGDALDRAFAGLRAPLEFDAAKRTYGGHVEVRVSTGTTIRLVPLRHGTRPVGLLACDASALPAGTLDALGGVIAIAIERAHLLAERQRSLAERDRADLASALLTSFSHDLRTPLTAVRMAVANLLDPSVPPDERQTQAGIARREIDRLARLFQDILDMARIDAAALRPEPAWTTPAEIVENAAAYLGPVLDTVRLDIAADDEAEVEVDPRLTAGALAHLLENAARVTPPDVAIAVGGYVGPDGLRLEVRDHGPGLDAADLEHVFEPFYRGVRSRHTSGTGLGLAITRGLLAAQRGRVWCENMPDGGARFTCVVPSPTRPAAREED